MVEMWLLVMVLFGAGWLDERLVGLRVRGLVGLGMRSLVLKCLALLLLSLELGLLEYVLVEVLDFGQLLYLELW